MLNVVDLVPIHSEQGANLFNQPRAMLLLQECCKLPYQGVQQLCMCTSQL